MEFLYDLSLFFFKAAITVSAALAIILIPLLALRAAGLEGKDKRSLKVELLKDKYKDYALQFRQKVLSKKDFKAHLKAEKKKKKAMAAESGAKPSCFALSFEGDVMASQAEALREEVSLILDLAKPKDEAVLLLESRGGSVAHYGLAASQLERLAGALPLTVSVDRVAGSGGYLMACAGSQIIAAPFAFIGSIGVLFGLPNVHEFLKKRDIAYEEVTAGKHKRTLTPFGKITDEKRDKLKEQLDLIHGQFKRFVKKRRDIDMERAATGEAWLAEEALKLGLVDKIQCSDDFLMDRLKTHKVYKISLKSKRPLWEKITKKAAASVSREILQNLAPEVSLNSNLLGIPLEFRGKTESERALFL